MGRRKPSEEAFQAHAASDQFERYIKNQVWLAMEERTRLLGAPIAWLTLRLRPPELNPSPVDSG